MTKVVFNYEKNGDILFDCMNHADDHDVCTIISTLCNVLVEECFAVDSEPTVYNPGHVRIDLYEASYPTLEVFRVVEKQIQHVAKQNPDFVKIY